MSSAPSSRRRAALRIARLRLQNWRNFRRVDVALAHRAFFVGPNASGKSNLLDALLFLRTIAMTGGGGLRAAVDQRGGVSRVRALAARDTSDVVLEVTLGENADQALWRYALEFNAARGGAPAVKREQAWSGGELVLDRPDRRDRDDPDRLQQTHLETTSENARFRPLAEYLAGIRFLHVVPQLLRHPQRVVLQRDDPFGTDLLERVARLPERQRATRLDRIAEAMRVAVPQLGSLKLHPDARGVPHLVGHFRNWRATKARQDEVDFSDGTLRLFGILWSLTEPGGPLLMEEPELSLHPALVRRLPSLLHNMHRRSGRQTLISTHSAPLLDDPGVELDEIHMLIPGENGTEVRSCADRQDLAALLERDVPIGELVLAETAASGLRGHEDLPLFAGRS